MIFLQIFTVFRQTFTEKQLANMQKKHAFGAFSLLFFAYLNTFTGADEPAILTTASADQLQQEKRLSDAIASINGL